MLTAFAIPSCSVCLGSALSALACLIFWYTGHTDSHQADFSTDYTDFHFSSCSITFLWVLVKLQITCFVSLNNAHFVNNGR